MRIPALMFKAPTVAMALEQERNNFALIRLCLAIAVVVSHAFSIPTGPLTDEPLKVSTGFSLGEHAVNGFFAVSGFLVTMSFDRRGWRDYVIARTLRIAPGLIVATLAVALLIGAAMTRLPLTDYFGSPDLRKFITATLTSFKSNTSLPGVFEGNPVRTPMATVWTLKYEFLCYVGVLVFGLTGLLRSRPATAILAAGLAVGLAGIELVSPDLPKGVETAFRLPLIFAFGGALYVWRSQARLSGLLVLAFMLAAWLCAGTFLYRTLLFTGSAYGILWLALSPALTRFSYEPEADLSYGTYLYGWPIQQSLHALWPAAGAVTMLAPALAATLSVAALSWFIIEKPALRLKARAMGRRTLRTIEPAAP